MKTEQLIHFLQHANAIEDPLQPARNALFQSSASRNAAVLLPIFKEETEWKILLTRRTSSLRRHSGEIALPGGKQDPDDADLTATATRETWEETGIPPSHWQTFPPLSPYYTPSGYSVHPVPALSARPPHTSPNPEEVDEIFDIPLKQVLNLHAYGKQPLTYQAQHLEMPVLVYRHHKIWGLTAMILHGLAERYRQYHAQP